MNIFNFLPFVKRVAVDYCTAIPLTATGRVVSIVKWGLAGKFYMENVTSKRIKANEMVIPWDERMKLTSRFGNSVNLKVNNSFTSMEVPSPTHPYAAAFGSLLK